MTPLSLTEIAALFVTAGFVMLVAVSVRDKVAPGVTVDGTARVTLTDAAAPAPSESDDGWTVDTNPKLSAAEILNVSPAPAF